MIAALSAICVVTWAVQAALPVDWHPVVAPLEQQPLMVRMDAKGSGQFNAPRSGNRRHRGVDLEAPVGSPVRAVRSGRVVKARRHRGLGRYVELAHRHGLYTLYAHLDTVLVKEGARIQQGQIIATVGKTGNARSRLIKSHLHFEVHHKGQPVDPGTLGLAFVPAKELAPTHVDD